MRSSRLYLLFALALLACVPAGAAPADLAAGFQKPPDSARPWVYWFWLNGNITREGITADLEAMKRVGIGGVLIMEVDQGAPKGPAGFGTPAWRELLKHVCSEAARLGIEVNMNNDAGWCGSGGPWITPDLAMQKLVWTETAAEGPGHVEAALAQPRTAAGYYRDVAVLAFPALADGARVGSIAGKASFAPMRVSLAPPAAYPPTGAERTFSRSKVLDLTAHLGADGKLSCDLPAGKWTILRLGHTPTGAVNHPAPADGLGFECDKLSKDAAKAMFDGLMGKLIADVGPLAGKTLAATHIDSWEVGVQNWTPRFRDEFKRRRGYDPLPLLPVVTGRVVESAEVSERFLWDLRQTVSELVLENYAGAFREMAHQHGMRLTIEAYTTCPTDEMAYAGRADEPMGEFWSWGKYGAAFSCTEMASAAHVYGKPIVGAEAFTASNGEAWLGHPGCIKDLGDWAFCEGINRFVFHRYALQPWKDVRPGMSMGPWGLHYERTQTWWEQSGAWHEYLARCQYLLQQGLFVADACLVGPEGSPQTLDGQRAFAGHERPRYNFDTCPPEVVLTRMSVENGRLVLPDGMSYRVLVLPRLETMTPALLRKVRDLVRAGATVMGPRPERSPSLSGYPLCDAEVKQNAAILWGTGKPPAALTGRRYGEGQVFWSADLQRSERADTGASGPLAGAKWIWRAEGNPAAAAPVGTRYFRRIFTLPAGRVASARLALTADNSFECWVNGRRAGSGDDFAQLYSFNVAALLRPGENVLAVSAVNGADAPNPAGLIGALSVRIAGGKSVAIATDKSWEAAQTVAGNWRTDAAPAAAWSPAMELGPAGMEPWGDVQQTAGANDIYPSLDTVCALLEKLGVPPDFTNQGAPGGLRYIHKSIAGTEVYFVANKNPQPAEALCSFRVRGRRPELWWPDTGRIERPAVYDEAGAVTRVPLRLGPSGSVFVLFPAGSKPEAGRLVQVARDGATVLDTAWQQPKARPASSNAGVKGSFTFAVWARPDADTLLPKEANTGVVGLNGPRNDALYPPPGHEVYSEEGQSGCGLAVGRNGVTVFEHGADYFAPVLVYPAPITAWTHVAVVYRNGRPSLYLNGRLVHQGLKGALTVHPGVGVAHERAVAAFKGGLGEFRQVNRALSDAEVAALARSMPRPADRAPAGALEVLRTADGRLEIEATQPGQYVLRGADGRTRKLTVAGVPAPVAVPGPWEVRFAPGGGAPERITLEKPTSWHENADPGVRYYSGVGTYTTTFDLPAGLLQPSRRLYLDLGNVAVIVDVTLNGRALGTLWKAPFRVEITGAAKAGANALEVKVANLWINRQIGDEQLPDDSDRNANGTLKQWPQWLEDGKPSPAGRLAFTSWRLWKKGSPLVESGLLGPVTVDATEVRAVP